MWKISLPSSWLSPLQKLFSAQADSWGFGSPPPPATIHSLFLLFPPPGSTPFPLQLSLFDRRGLVGYKFLRMVRSVPGRLCLYASWSPPSAWLKLARTRSQAPRLIQPRRGPVSFAHRHHLCRVPCAYWPSCNLSFTYSLRDEEEVIPAGSWWFGIRYWNRKSPFEKPLYTSCVRLVGERTRKNHFHYVSSS